VRRVRGLVAVALLAAGCSDGAASRAANTFCTRGHALEADVDGDGRLDRAWLRWVRGAGARVGVCTAAGQVDDLGVGGMAEGPFDALDVNGDGAADLVHGGTTVSQAVSEVTVFLRGRLRPVVDERGERIVLVEGTTDAWRLDAERGVLVQETVRQGEPAVTAYRVRGATAVIATESP
jgi:hypothetical protein